VIGAAALAAAALASTPVGVAEREFRISLYRPVVPPGEVRFNVTNFGEDTHDLAVVRGPRGFRRAYSPEIRAGQRALLTARLTRPGTYSLICTLADHAARGMRAKLVVRRPARRRG
jgi:plastocyanin